MLMAQALFFGVILYITIATEGTSTHSMANLLIILVPLWAFLVLIAGTAMFKRKTLEIQEDQRSNTAQKLNKYRSALIINWAMIEALALFCLISYLLVRDLLYLVLFACLFFLFLSKRPTKERTLSDTGLPGSIFK